MIYSVKGNFRFIFALFLLISFSGIAAGQTTYYVDKSAGTGGDGTSWGNAFKYLQDILMLTLASNDIILVAEGTYYPDEDEASHVTNNNRGETFEMFGYNLKIYGGYPAGGGPRDISLHETILSGDIQQDDVNSNKAYHVFSFNCVGSSALLDGFTITKGYANGVGADQQNGGGINNIGSGIGNNSDPRVVNCTITDNHASYGGGMYNDGSGNGSCTPTIMNCTFSDNFAGNIGGGLYFFNSSGNPVIKGCTFTGNSSADQGGGIYASYSACNIDSCTFSTNTAVSDGGALCNYNFSGGHVISCTFTNNNTTGDNAEGGAVYNNDCDPEFDKCTFNSNSAGVNDGGAIYNHDDRGDGILITNSTFWNNSAGNGGAVATSATNNTKISNCTFSSNSASIFFDAVLNSSNIWSCILWGSTDQIGGSPTVKYSDIKGSYSGTGNINHDPLFKNEGSGNFLLLSGSPCLGTGYFVGANYVPTTDKDGRSRPLPASDIYVDMGAYEQYADGSLAVELSIFSASFKNGSVLLFWRTESEVDNLGFILERREDEEWRKIASYLTHDDLKGQGNTSSAAEYEFEDNIVVQGKTYKYRLSDVNSKGEINVYSPISISIDSRPLETKLDYAYPNPFNPQIFIGYHLQEETRVTISVFDILGRFVKELYTGRQAAGSYHIYWNGTNRSGVKVPSGSYILRMKTENLLQTQRVIFMK